MSTAAGKTVGIEVSYPLVGHGLLIQGLFNSGLKEMLDLMHTA